MKNMLLIAAFAVAPFVLRAEESPRYLYANASVEERVRDLLGRMTLEEKIAQMDEYTVWDALAPVNRKTLSSIGIGSMLGEFNAKQYAEIQKLTAQSRLKIPVLLGIDACHGNAFYPGATVFPSNISMAATFDRNMAGDTARHAAAEIRGWGHEWIFTPTLDVTRDQRFGRSGEAFGESSYVTAEMARAYVAGYQGAWDFKSNVAACVKHYVGGGVSEGGVNHASAEISERTLRQVYLPPFKAAVDAGCLTVMAGHNDVAGVPMHANKWLLTDVLKGEFGFSGFVVSDMGDVRNLEGRLHHVAATHDDALAMGVNAGIDVYMNSKDRNEFIEPMLSLVQYGRVSQSRVDDAVTRILRVKFKLGLFDRSFDKSSDTTPASLVTPEAEAVALRGARECLTLLKNDKALLPLKRGAYRKILVTGPDADNQAILGDWAFKQPNGDCETVVDAIRKTAGPDTEIVFAKSGRIKGKPAKISREAAETADLRVLNQRIAEADATLDDPAIDAAARAAKDTDLVVAVVGGFPIRSEWGLRTYGESCDSPSIGLPGRQLDLVKALKASGKPVVVVYVSGKVCNEPWVNDNIPAILYAWEPGKFGARAIAETLFGDNNPSGRLPFTFPKTAAHIPNYHDRRSSRLWTGYGFGSSRADDMPSYEFGYGLSYTTFKYDNLKVPGSLPLGSDIPVSVDITNTGKIAGEDAILLFFSDVVASVAPALKELKGFDRVSLKPGESKTVSFIVTPDQLALWNPEMKHVVEPGDFIVRVGDRTATVTLTGNKDWPVK